MYLQYNKYFRLTFASDIFRYLKLLEAYIFLEDNMDPIHINV